MLLAMTVQSFASTSTTSPAARFPAVPCPMRGREKIRRGRFARKEQSPVDRRRQHGAGAGVAGQRVRIGAAREGVVGPARFRQRLQFAAVIVAEERRRSRRCFAPPARRRRRLPVRLRETAAEKAFDAGLAERAQMIGAHRGAHGGAAQIAVLRQRLRLVQRQHHLVGKAERQAARGVDLCRQRAGGSGSIRSAIRLVGTVTITLPADSVPREVSIRRRCPE